MKKLYEAQPAGQMKYARLNANAISELPRFITSQKRGLSKSYVDAVPRSLSGLPGVSSRTC